MAKYTDYDAGYNEALDVMYAVFKSAMVFHEYGLATLEEMMQMISERKDELRRLPLDEEDEFDKIVASMFSTTEVDE